jgi:hypothetical protein
MSEWVVATRVGAEVRPEVVETEEETGETCVRSCKSERGSAGAGAGELPERGRRGSQDVEGSTPVQEGTRAVQRSEPLHLRIEPEQPYTYLGRKK